MEIFISGTPHLATVEQGPVPSSGSQMLTETQATERSTVGRNTRGRLIQAGMPAEQISLTREAIERSGTLPPTILKDLPMELKQKIFGELRSDSALKHS